jgi:pimeloyl-ACP methyl ester carboxylesterase
MDRPAPSTVRPPDPSPRSRRRTWRAVLAVVVVAVLLLSTAFFVYVSDFSRATPAAVAALASDAAVQVVEVPSGWAFVPTGETESTGLVVYPGGKVDEKAYAPLCRALAEAGYPVALVRMPFKLAVFGIGRGKDGMRDLESALASAGKSAPSRYVAAGHSLGGVMAARFALTDPSRFAGVAFWAAYADQDLKPAGFAAVTILGSEDKVLDLAAVAKARANLPVDAETVVVPGGNHAGFGDYGAQKGDGTATISGADQRAAVVAAMKTFLERLLATKGGAG